MMQLNEGDGISPESKKPIEKSPSAEAPQEQDAVETDTDQSNEPSPLERAGSAEFARERKALQARGLSEKDARQWLRDTIILVDQNLPTAHRSYDLVGLERVGTNFESNSVRFGVARQIERYGGQEGIDALMRLINQAKQNPPPSDLMNFTLDFARSISNITYQDSFGKDEGRAALDALRSFGREQGGLVQHAVNEVFRERRTINIVRVATWMGEPLGRLAHRVLVGDNRSWLLNF